MESKVNKLKSEMVHLENRLRASESHCVAGQTFVEDRRSRSSDVRRCQRSPASASANTAVLSMTRPVNRSVSNGGHQCSRSECISGGDGIPPIYPNEGSPPPYRMIRTSAATNTRKKTFPSSV
ncbi:unnamed protein product [Hydatigera taeniaeformis]|uniref:CCDC92 domain-containing protein n=1 Tax=Hydatigena taeniaeformis TaxID=6205 RepID=A0A0R3X9Z1_HYDTA|nr:unnamed protein product [Hydatigera taeniaeformis]